jgi:hypothetical protein
MGNDAPTASQVLGEAQAMPSSEPTPAGGLWTAQVAPPFAVPTIALDELTASQVVVDPQAISRSPETPLAFRL